jgi:pyruvate,water dikinase
VIVPLDSPAARERADVGGKARTLARLLAAGFPVPSGFVVTSVDDVRRPDCDTALDTLARGDNGMRFAVRSSGEAEDSTGASFAGQFQTVLGVRTSAELRDAIERCFASFATAVARGYQHAVGVYESGGAVLVQELIEAEAAGVAFTRDPVSGAADRVVVDAAAGLGDRVVGGLVTPDSFTIDSRTRDVVTRRIAGSEACLGDAALGAIAALALGVEAALGCPVDIEWAWRGGRLYLLQARPITTPTVGEAAEPPANWTPQLNTRIDPRFPLYSRGNVGEILPGCVPPLTYGFFARGIERAFRDLAETLGSMRDVGPDPIVVGFFFHRVYLNVSYFMAAADNSPGATRDTVYEELIGPPPSRHPAWTIGDIALPWRLLRGLRIISRFLALQRQLDADIADCRARYDESRRDFTRQPPSTWSNDELAAWLEVDEAGLKPALVHIRASQFANSSFTSLRGMTKTSLGDDTGTIASTLVTGIGAIATAAPAAALYDLAALATHTPAVRAHFDAERDDERLLARLRSDDEAQPFCAAFDEFIDRFGHRGFREADFRSPSWRERPAQVLPHVREYLAAGTASPAGIAQRQAARAAEARAAALPRIPSWKRGFFAAVLTSARKHIAARETMKDLVLRFVDLTRLVIAAAKDRLAAGLGDPDDIYFLLPAELAAALRGEIDTAAVMATVRRRRRELAWCERVDVPKVQEGTARCVPRGHAASTRGGAELTGVAVSPGVVEGRAAVVLTPAAASAMPGDIIVAPVTDVAWTPLFLRAAALVVEVGGPLSHGSIVAREYGIPAVTAVAGALERIRTGDRLRVDGGRGTVTILGRD